MTNKCQRKGHITQYLQAPVYGGADWDFQHGEKHSGNSGQDNRISQYSFYEKPWGFVDASVS